MISSFLFPQKISERNCSLLLLAARIIFGILIIMHGIQKLEGFETLSAGLFPDPLGIGSKLSICLAIFGELACGIAFTLGFLFRLATIPMIFTMIVAFFGVHGGSIAGGELAFAYLIVFCLMFSAGAGRYSVDYFIAKWFNQK